MSAAFSRGGRVALVSTTARGHGTGHLHPGSGIAALRRAYPRLRRLGRTLWRVSPTSPRLFGLRHGRARYVAVTSRRTIARRRTLRALLRRAGRL